MKILLVILHANAARGGAERYTLDLAAALVARGHRVTLAAGSFENIPDGVERIDLGMSGATRVGRYRRFLGALDAHLAQADYDVVHAMLPVRRCDVYHPHAGLAAEAMAAGHLKYDQPAARMVARWSNRLNARRRAFCNVEKQLLNDPNPPVVLCLSQAMQAIVRRHYDLTADRLVTLFNAVDLRRYDPAARPDARSHMRRKLGASHDQPVALMIAQDFSRKGLPEALEALARLPRGQGESSGPSPRLVVVGRGDVAPHQRKARELGIEALVTFAGPTADPYSFYASADLFVLPTHHDPCSLVVLEALAMGVPVITTRQNGAAEIMTQGQEGFILDSPADRVGLIEAWKALCDPTTRARMSKAAMALRPKLAYERHLDALLSVYESIISARTPSLPPVGRDL